MIKRMKMNTTVDRLNPVNQAMRRRRNEALVSERRSKCMANKKKDEKVGKWKQSLRQGEKYFGNDSRNWESGKTKKTAEEVTGTRYKQVGEESNKAAENGALLMSTIGINACVCTYCSTGLKKWSAALLNRSLNPSYPDPDDNDTLNHPFIWNVGPLL